MSLVSFLEKHLLACPSKTLLHMECPGCGMQRSFILLLKGDLPASLQMHPATIPMMGLIVFAMLHMVFKFSKGAKVIVIFQLIVAFIVISFYIYKIANHKIYT
jgi:hypothetical protein